MRYPGLEKRAAELLLTGEVPEHEVLQWFGEGPMIDVDSIMRLVTEIQQTIETYGPSLRQRSPVGGEFEAHIVESVHRTFTDATRRDPKALADDRFWRWAAVCPFKRIIEWRHPPGEKGFNLENFGMGPLAENFVYRVWLRGDIGYDPDRYPRDPYKVARRGRQDFWRSHVFRQAYGNCREFARALVHFQYPDDETAALGGDDLRELAKRLRRLYANVVFEALRFEEALELIDAEAHRVMEGRATDGHRGVRTGRKADPSVDFVPGTAAG